MQAARGASLTSSDAGPSGPEASARRAARTILVVVALAAYVVDIVFSLVAITAVCVVLWFSRRVADPVWAIAFGLLLAGIGGNLTDRIFRDPAPLRGHVVDLFMIPNWPVFNVADICIDVAAALILLQAFRNVRLDGSRPSRDLPEEKAA